MYLIAFLIAICIICSSNKVIVHNNCTSTRRKLTHNNFSRIIFALEGGKATGNECQASEGGGGGGGGAQSSPALAAGAYVPLPEAIQKT